MLSSRALWHFSLHLAAPKDAWLARVLAIAADDPRIVVESRASAHFIAFHDDTEDASRARELLSQGLSPGGHHGYASVEDGCLVFDRESAGDGSTEVMEAFCRRLLGELPIAKVTDDEASLRGTDADITRFAREIFGLDIGDGGGRG